MTYGENTPMRLGRGQILGILQPLKRLQDDRVVGCESTSAFCLIPTTAKSSNNPSMSAARRSMCRCRGRQWLFVLDAFAFNHGINVVARNILELLNITVRPANLN